MSIKIAVLAIYFLAVLIIGFLAKSRLRESPGEYFLGGRKLGILVLASTMIATNFSAFTVFGASGSGYRDGMAFFPIMGFGTGFMAISFWIIGRKVWQIGRKFDLVTPPELIGKIYENRRLQILFAIIMIIFTIPYLALQPMSGGYILNQLFGLNQIAGASIVTLIMLLYILRGGFKAVVWTDLLQGILMFGLMVVALVVVSSHYGGFSVAMKNLLHSNPELFSRPGAEGTYTYGIWFSYIVLWFLCDPMFPQLFQRFYTAKSERTLASTMMLYPVICTIVFILPVCLGMLGHFDYPGLQGKEADNVISMLATGAGGDFLGTLILAAGLAALMSTMDSQLLTLSSIFTNDIYPIFAKGKSPKAFTGRMFTIALAFSGLAIAVNPPGTILDIATWAFTGLAVLFPVVLFGLYLKKPSGLAGILSLIAGQTMVILYAVKLLPTFGLLPVIPVIIVTTVVYLFIQQITSGLGFIAINRRNWFYAGMFLLIFLAAMDFSRWNKVGGIMLGLPSWVWVFILLSGVQTVVMYYWVRKEFKRGSE